MKNLDEAIKAIDVKTHNKDVDELMNKTYDNAIKMCDEPLADSKFIETYCRNLFEDYQRAITSKNESRLNAVKKELEDQKKNAFEHLKNGKLSKTQYNNVISSIEKCFK